MVYQKSYLDRRFWKQIKIVENYYNIFGLNNTVPVYHLEQQYCLYNYKFKFFYLKLLWEVNTTKSIKIIIMSWHASLWITNTCLKGPKYLLEKHSYKIFTLKIIRSLGFSSGFDFSSIESFNFCKLNFLYIPTSNFIKHDFLYWK